MSYHIYTAFGLKFRSKNAPIAWGKGQADSGVFDVQIDFESFEIPIELQDKPTFQRAVSDADYMLRVPGVATYKISSGRHIYVDVADGANLNSVDVYLTGSAMSVLLTQRNIYSFHGNAIQVGDGAVLFSGDSGAGKSTVAAAFWQAGFSLLSDDVCAINCTQSPCMVSPAYPHIKLWGEILDYFKLDRNDYVLINKDWPKYYISLGEQFCADALPVKAIFFLSIDPEITAIEVSELKGIALFDKMMNNAHRPQYIGQLNKNPEFFEQVSNLCRSVQAFQIKRPAEKMVVDDIIKVVKGYFVEGKHVSNK